MESHIILLLGAASRGNIKQHITLDEKMVYILVFLMTEDHKKLRTKLYHFKKGLELPESDVLKQCLRNPRMFKDCWIITETGIELTEKGVDKFRQVIKYNKDILETFVGLLTEISTNKISIYELEKIVQLRYPNYITKYTDKIEQALRTNPSLNREQLLKELTNADYIHEQVSKAVFVNAVETRKYGKGSITAPTTTTTVAESPQ